MLRLLSFLCVVLAISLSCETTHAQPGHGGHGHHGGGSYPLVYGATGRPYGPTQSHYQYEKRYGRPWHGEGSHGHGYGTGQVNGGPGLSINLGWNGPFFPNPYSLYGPQYYGPSPYYGPAPYPAYTPLPPLGFQSYIPGVPGYSSSSAYYERQTFGPQLLNGPLAPSPLDIAAPGLNQPSIVTPTLSFPQSTPAAQVESLHFMAQGDLQLRTMNFLAAADRYRNAIQAARDLAEPRYRFALTRVGRSQFAEAVEEFKIACQLKPDWLNDSQSLDDLFGVDNLLGKTQLKQRVADWLLQDGRDPNRLFLLGVLLRMDGDDRSQILIETAIKVAGPQQHLISVLDNSRPLPDTNPEVIQKFTPPVTLPNPIPNEPHPELANPPARPPLNLQGPILPGVN